MGKLINWKDPVTEAPPQKAKPKPRPKIEATYLDMPESAMYGYLGDAARSLDGPLGWCYASCLSIYAGMNGTCIDDANEYNTLRPNINVALLGPPGYGKSVAIDRAVATLKPGPDNIETDTAASDKGLYRLFGFEKDEEPYLRSVCMVQDEMRDLFQKIGINGSSLPQVLCKLFNHDQAGVADAKAHHRMYVRLSLLGGIATEDIDDFQSVFGSNTTSGLYTRFILIPPPATEPYWDFNWQPNFPAPTNNTKVRISPRDRTRTSAWEREYKTLGYDPIRLGEIALRIAVLTSAANGETKISDACMNAALEFASWQAAVKWGYQPGRAKNDEAELADAMIRAFREHGKDENNRPMRLKFSKIVKKKNWNRKYGAPMVQRVMNALGSQHTIIVELGL